MEKQSYSASPVDNRLLHRFGLRIENFSQTARDGLEVSFSFQIFWEFHLRVADGRVEVRYANFLSNLAVELTFLDLNKFALFRVRADGGRRGVEQVLIGPPLEDIVEHLASNGRDLLLLFLFLKPHRNIPTSPIPALEGLSTSREVLINPPSSIEPEDEFNDYLTVQCSRFLQPNFPRPVLERPTCDRLIPGVGEKSISRKELQDPPSSKELKDALNSYLAFRRRKRFLISRRRSKRRPNSDRLIPALEGLSISREKPLDPPSSIASEDASNVYPPVQRRKLLQPNFRRIRRPTSDPLIPALERLSIGRKEPPSSGEPTPSTNELVDILKSDIHLSNMKRNMEMYRKTRDESFLNKVNEFLLNFTHKSRHLRVSPY